MTLLRSGYAVQDGSAHHCRELADHRCDVQAAEQTLRPCRHEVPWGRQFVSVRSTLNVSSRVRADSRELRPNAEVFLPLAAPRCVLTVVSPAALLTELLQWPHHRNGVAQVEVNVLVRRTVQEIGTSHVQRVTEAEAGLQNCTHVSLRNTSFERYLICNYIRAASDPEFDEVVVWMIVLTKCTPSIFFVEQSW